MPTGGELCGGVGLKLDLKVSESASRYFETL